MHDFDRYDREMQSLQRPRQSAKSTRQHECYQSCGGDVIAGSLGAGLVFTDRLNHSTEGRCQNSRQQKERRDHKSCDHVVARQRVDEIKPDTQDVDGPDIDAAQSVFAASPVHGLIKQVVDTLRQGHCHHCEVDAAGPDRKHTDHRCHQ